MELPSLRVAPRPLHPRGSRGSFSSSSKGFTGTDSLCSFNSSQLLGDTGEELEEEEDDDDGEDVSAGEDGEGMDAGGEDVEEVDDGGGGATVTRVKTLWRRRCGRRECRRHG
ncbi:hypothetical protein PF011_g28889 [Phytophthora fragariae]|uniref:Uncharacterized protein n=1 Tax=Phytophthora fragariae TaxID=53985 RepID=A0A6A3H3T8_9STRA|nr:hypothetical protein PF011_g28889 [Phytophthora fragariae]